MAKLTSEQKQRVKQLTEFLKARKKGGVPLTQEDGSVLLRDINDGKVRDAMRKALPQDLQNVYAKLRGDYGRQFQGATGGQTFDGTKVTTDPGAKGAPNQAVDNLGPVIDDAMDNNKQTMIDGNIGRNPDIIGPDYDVVSKVDPVTGKVTQEIVLSGEQEDLRDAGIDLGVAGDTMGLDLLKKSIFEQFDPAKFGAVPSWNDPNFDRKRIEDSIYGDYERQFEPALQQQVASFEQQMADRGIPAGSPQYNNLYKSLLDQQAATRAGWKSEAMAAGADEQSSRFNQGMQTYQQRINDWGLAQLTPIEQAQALSGLGSTYTAPNPAAPVGTDIAPVDTLGATLSYLDLIVNDKNTDEATKQQARTAKAQIEAAAKNQAAANATQIAINEANNRARADQIDQQGEWNAGLSGQTTQQSDTSQPTNSSGTKTGTFGGTTSIIDSMRKNQPAQEQKTTKNSVFGGGARRSTFGGGSSVFNG